MHVVLVEPEIPPNTGNIARLCAATLIPLHLVGPLGFRMTDRQLQRAGLDYWPLVQIHRHASLSELTDAVSPARLHFFSRRGERSYVQARFQDGDYLIFGSETRGLPARVFEEYPNQIWNIPMFHAQVRSLNLANSVAIIVYEALRQIGRL